MYDSTKKKTIQCRRRSIFISADSLGEHDEKMNAFLSEFRELAFLHKSQINISSSIQVSASREETDDEYNRRQARNQKRRATLQKNREKNLQKKIKKLEESIEQSKSELNSLVKLKESVKSKD